MVFKTRLLALSISIIVSLSAHAEVKMANQVDMAANPIPNGDAMLEVTSSDKGILLPRVAITSPTSAAPLTSHVQGMSIYNTTDNGSVSPCIYHNTGAKWVSGCDTEWYESGGTNTSLNSKSNEVYRKGGIGINEIGSDTDFEVSEELEIQGNNPTILLNDNNSAAYNTGIYWADTRRANFGIHSDTSSAGNMLTFANYRPYGNGGGFKWWATKPAYTDWQLVEDNGSSDTMTTSIAISRMETVMLLSQTGNLTIDGTLTQNSDERLKKNIQPITSALSSLNEIKAVTYNWKLKEQNVHDYEYGFLAQNVESIFPQLVRTEEETGIKSVAYANMTPILVKAVQELVVELEELKKTDDALRAENTALRLENAAIESELQSVKATNAAFTLTEIELIQLKSMLNSAKTTRK